MENRLRCNASESAKSILGRSRSVSSSGSYFMRYSTSTRWLPWWGWRKSGADDSKSWICSLHCQLMLTTPCPMYLSVPNPPRPLGGSHLAVTE